MKGEPMGDRVKTKTVRNEVSEAEALRRRLEVDAAQNATLLRRIRDLEGQLAAARQALRVV